MTLGHDGGSESMRGTSFVVEQRSEIGSQKQPGWVIGSRSRRPWLVIQGITMKSASGSEHRDAHVFYQELGDREIQRKISTPARVKFSNTMWARVELY